MYLQHGGMRKSIMEDVTLPIEMTGIWLLRFYAAMENTLRIKRNKSTMPSTDDAEQRVLVSKRPSKSADITTSILIIP